MSRIKLQLTVLLATMINFSCGNASTEDKPGEKSIRFEREKWQQKVDDDYPNREAMLDDLVGSKKLKGKNRQEVLSLLGRPDRTDSLYLFYLVEQSRLQGFPLHTTTLVVKLSRDSTVDWVKIHK